MTLPKMHKNESLDDKLYITTMYYMNITPPTLSIPIVEYHK